MNKLDLKSMNIIENNIEKIAKLFPNVVKEDSDKLAIDFDTLKQELSIDLIDEKKEKYELTWPGKKEAIVNANTPSKNILRPLKDKSVDFDTTKNIFIEGDNLDVLKILQESYLEKIKCIYIDPPYNTGNDFIYNDNFSKEKDTELINSGQVDELGNRLISNTQANGRFHSDWLSMMYPRLKLARNLLKKDGILFYQIGDDELTNSQKILNEIFGEKNCLGIVTRVAKTASNKGTFFAPSVDYILCYSKDVSKTKYFKDEVDESLYKKVEEKGNHKGEKYRDDVALFQSGLIGIRDNCRYYIECPDGSKVIPPGRKFWRWGKDTLEKNKDLLVFKESKTSPLLDENGNKAKWNIYTKSYLSDREKDGTVPRNYIDKFLNRSATDNLKKININFDYSKPVNLIKYLLKISNIENNDIVLDFFAGSATTAHAILDYNVCESKKVRYIMVQMPETIDNNSFKNICDLGEERIRRAGKAIKEETKTDIDYGFRVFKVDSSNMKDDFYKIPGELEQSQLSLFETNIKEDRSEDDLLTGVVLDLGLTLDYKVEEKNIKGNKVYYVNGNELVACFDESVDIDIIDEVSKIEPLMAVFRDDSFKTDSDKINLEERFKKISPNTKISIL